MAMGESYARESERKSNAVFIGVIIITAIATKPQLISTNKQQINISMNEYLINLTFCQI